MEDQILISEKNTDVTSELSTEDFANRKTILLKTLPKSAKKFKQLMLHSLNTCDKAIDKSVLYILEKCVDYLYENDTSTCLAQTEIIIDLSWEKLNSFHWKDVPSFWQKCYSFSRFFEACCLAYDAKSNPDLVEICYSADMALLMGHDILNGILHEICEIFKPVERVIVPDGIRKKNQLLDPKITNAIEITSMPSLENFLTHMNDAIPVLLENCIEHWDARKLWGFHYLNEVAGHRLVPVEIGSKYTDDSWGQQLMTISKFIENYVFSNDSNPRAYLAQHRLFDQIPKLRRDICVPDYCCLSKLENCNPETDTELNAWFGPSGTVSPCHYDIKHNLLAQVVGRKYIRLYSPSCKSALYPHEGMLNNTSQVDVENPDHNKFPLFHEMDEANREECILQPGQMLYIPPGYWHYVRSLDESFSVSFWWN